MRTYQQTVREGEDMGPIDWSHPMAADKPDHWREAEKNPERFEFCDHYMFTPRRIAKLCMYDGWPYWTPTPAILRESPMGGFEWTHFNSYGVTADAIRPIGEAS